MAGEKTEEPTHKRLRDARQKGQVAQSKDLTSTILLITAFTVIGLGWRGYLATLQELMVMPSHFYDVPFEDAFPQVMTAVLMKVIAITLPILVAVLIAAIASSFFQVGAILSFEPIMPKFDKLNPFNKLKEMFGIKGIIELIKNLVKTVFLGVLIVIVIRDLVDAIVRIPYAGLDGLLEILGPVMKKLATNVALAYVVFGAFDYFLQKRQHIKGLRMSKEEVKQEYKEMEGNPEIKSKRKQLQKELMNQNTMQKTRKSTVLVTNPTHRAVALDYKKGRTKLPVVVAKGEGFLAQKMIEIAKEEGIPIMQNVPLARALFDEVPVDQFIPADLIEPVAEVLRWVQQLKQQREQDRQ
jgi:type III secretion protein U